ncbi:MAG TPA: DUF1499 domain-containing protein [Thermoanaerobaculia bacterium]|nr:DUF1499 domain-containing protein [Thermoanaerobaculia bacterium]
MSPDSRSEPLSLPPCRRRNCVSSLEARVHYRIEPLRFTGDSDAAWRRLVELVRRQPRARIVAEEPERLKAVFRSLIFRFPDDVDFVLDPDARVIHVRSASRYGRRDYGVNRQRVEALRRAFEGGG